MPRGYFLCKQKVTKKLPKPEVLDSSYIDFVLRPRLSLFCLNQYRPLPRTSASVWECSYGSANTWRNRPRCLSDMRRRKRYGLLFEDLRESFNSAFPIAASTSLKGRQAESFKYQSPRSEPRRISCSRGTATLHLRPMSANPPPRRRALWAAPRGRSGTPGSSDFLVTFCSHKK